MPNKKCRAICIHGISATQIWRGPVRADLNLAEVDLKEHKAMCEHTDNSIIYEGDPLWE